MRARQENLRAARFSPHVVNIGANSITIAENFARQQFVAPHDRLAAAEIDYDVAVLNALDDAVDDIADAILVLRILPVALSFAYFLHDYLFGRLRGDAAVFERRQGICDRVADLGSRMALARLFQRDLV